MVIAPNNEWVITYIYSIEKEKVNLLKDYQQA